MKTGFSLLEILHRETPVFITGMGLQCSPTYQKIYVDIFCPVQIYGFLNGVRSIVLQSQIVLMCVGLD